MKLNIAIVGCDTSHAVEFSRIFNDEHSVDHVPGARVIAAVTDGLGAMAGSRTRAIAHSAEIEAKYNVKLYEEIADLPLSCDAVIIGATDCTRHLELVEELVKMRVPIFIDKPIAPTGVQAHRIFHIGREMNVPIMSASALRYDSHFQGALRAAMGTGLTEVAVVHREFYDVITAVWRDGRIGTIRGMRAPHHTFGGTLHKADGPVPFALPEQGTLFYAELLKQVVNFASTGISPIPSDESIEIIRFLEAAERQRSETCKAASDSILQNQAAMLA